MKSKPLAVLLVVVGLLMISGPAFAHHSEAAYDLSNSSLILASSAAQHFAVDLKRHDIRLLAAVSGDMNSSGNLVACLNGIPGPASPAQVVRRSHFANPLCDVALLVLHLKMNSRMGINKLEFRYCSL